MYIEITFLTAFLTMQAGVYPAEAIRKGEEGVALVKVAINAKGRVTDCTIAKSSGSASLDRASCVNMRQARFKPLLDASGKAITSVREMPVRWTLPSGASRS